MAEYRAGVCNIGREQRRKRYRAGVLTLAIALAYSAWIVVADRPDAYFAGAFFLYFGGMLGYLQARLEFCVAFGALARYDLSGGDGEEGTVDDAELRRKDRLRALELTAYAAGLAAALTLLLYSFDGFLLA
ncbi:hypothetical protein BRC81_14795 [Halobacteriales archaeon QS_1_68_20]|nr:MAG: hypothetical protein BRC81_14795 [Halobacteriales archaeon QS_1_68_20]